MKKYLVTVTINEGFEIEAEDEEHALTEAKELFTNALSEDGLADYEIEEVKE